MMTTAKTSVVKEDTVTPADPFDYGSGRVDLTKAGNPGLTFDETAERMFALGNDPVAAVHLNLPSINAPTLPGELTTYRTASNVSSQAQTYKVTTTAPAGSKITVTPASFTLNPGKSGETEGHDRVERADGAVLRADQAGRDPGRHADPAPAGGVRAAAGQRQPGQHLRRRHHRGWTAAPPAR